MMGFQTRVGLTLTLIGSLFLASHMGFAAQRKLASVEGTLFQKLGGKKGLKEVVEDFVARATTDKRISTFFAATEANKHRLHHFKSELMHQLCMATGGPCKYHGKSMKAAHHGMGISTNDFEAMVDDLKMTLEKFKVPKDEQGQLLAILEPMKKDIVEPKAK